MTGSARFLKWRGVEARAMMAACVVVLIWSTSFSFAKDAILNVGPWWFRFYSTLAGLLVLLPLLRQSLTDLFRMEGKQRRPVLWAVTINGTLVASINMLALAYFPATTVLTLMYTMPAFAGIMEALHLRRSSWSAVLSPVAALSGVLLYVGGTGMNVGGLMILLNAGLWAVGTLLSARCGQAFTASALVTVQTLIAFLFSIALIVVVLLRGDGGAVWPGNRDLAGIFHVGVVNGPVAFGLWYYAVHRLGAVRASGVTLWVPVIGAISAVLVFGETLGWMHAAGIALVVLGMAFRMGILSSPPEGPKN